MNVRSLVELLKAHGFTDNDMVALAQQLTTYTELLEKDGALKRLLDESAAFKKAVPGR